MTKDVLELRLQGRDAAVPVYLRRSRQARRLSLRVSALDGRVTLTLPARTPEAQARRFLADQSPWLAQQLSGMGPIRAPRAGDPIPIEGEMTEIRLCDTTRVPMREPGLLRVPRGAENLSAILAVYLRELARVRLTSASDTYARQLGRGYERIVLRDTRSRWGSCSVSGRLMYSWRLIMAPRDVLDYVAAHEVAHLREMNHSPAFWAHVARLKPDFEADRAWLRSNGSTLHRWRFDS